MPSEELWAALNVMLDRQNFIARRIAAMEQFLQANADSFTDISRARWGVTLTNIAREEQDFNDSLPRVSQDD